jgi:hypothetical protein
MNWKYYIMHSFKDDWRMKWAELYIIPDDPSYNGEALWVTIDCIGESPRHKGEDEVKFHKEAKKLLGDADYRVCEEDEMGDSDMLINAEDFSKDEFLEYVKIWIKKNGFQITDLISAPVEDFSGRGDNADAINEIIKNYGDEE